MVMGQALLGGARQLLLPKGSIQVLFYQVKACNGYFKNYIYVSMYVSMYLHIYFPLLPLSHSFSFSISIPQPLSFCSSCYVVLDLLGHTA